MGFKVISITPDLNGVAASCPSSSIVLPSQLQLQLSSAQFLKCAVLASERILLSISLFSPSALSIGPHPPQSSLGRSYGPFPLSDARNHSTPKSARLHLDSPLSAGPTMASSLPSPGLVHCTCSPTAALVSARSASLGRRLPTTDLGTRPVAWPARSRKTKGLSIVDNLTSPQA